LLRHESRGVEKWHEKTETSYRVALVLRGKASANLRAGAQLGSAPGYCFFYLLVSITFLNSESELLWIGAVSNKLQTFLIRTDQGRIEVCRENAALGCNACH
jgi:hypothetical protein